MGYTRVCTGRKNERGCVWIIDKTVESLCVVETTESSCVAETICKTGPVGKWIGKSLRGSNSTLPCVPTWTHLETN